ncbi:MAG: YidC/Oxa1 family membrane protein insertase [Candidatus Limnocylindria bacterium]
MTPIIGAGFLGIEHFTPPWDVFFLPLFNLLVALFQIPFFDFALAIIVFTIVIRTILAPLFIRQIRSQKEMQRMQPLIREVQRKHKGNRQKVSEETMALYKEHGVNPAAGCLPVVLQLPILFALYQALIRASGVITGFTINDGNRDAFEALQSANVVESVAGQADTFRVAFEGVCNLPEYSQLPQFLPLNCQLIDPIKLSGHVDTTVGWLLGLDLARIDHVFAIPLFGFALSLLAVIAGVLQFVQVKMTSPRPNPEDPTSGMTSTMTYTFPLLTIVWGGIFPSGLILYWIVYTAYLVIQQFLIMGWGNLFPIFGWQPAWAPSPETGITPASRPKRTDGDAAPTEEPKPPTPRAPSPNASRGSNPRPGSRPKGSAKRRGRKR